MDIRYLTADWKLTDEDHAYFAKIINDDGTIVFARPVQSVQFKADWEEAEHPRHEKGAPKSEGGEFAPKADSWERVGKAGGTQGAQWYRDPETGDKYIVKGQSYSDPDRVATEVLAGKVYRALGIDVPDIRATTINGKPVSVSKELVGAKLKNRISSDKDLQKGFMGDVFVANWDVVGLVYDNILYVKDKPYRVDLGGSFTFRAQGGPKSYGSTPTEHKALVNPDINEQSSDAFGKIPKADLRKQAAHVAEVMTDAKIDSLVKSVGFKNRTVQNQVIEGMKGRRDWMANFAKTGEYAETEEDYAEQYKAIQWDEDKHPRQPSGDDKGGEFAPKIGQRQGALPNLESLGTVYDPKALTSMTRESIGKNPSMTEAKAKKLLEGYGEWIDSITGDESKWVERYAGISYLEINRVLRGDMKDVPIGGDVIEERDPIGNVTYRSKMVPASDVAKVIERALDKASLPTPLLLYRDIGVTKEEAAHFKPGRVFSDTAFTSTTLRPDAMLGTGYDNNLKLVISAPRGAKATYLNGLALHPQEAEVLIQRNARFKITGISDKPNQYGQTEVFVRLL